MGEVLEELQRYVPSQDPRQTLLRDPTWLLRLERSAPLLAACSSSV